ELVRGWIGLPEGAQGNKDAAVFVAHAEAALGFLDDTNHHKVRAVDPDVFPDRMTLGKQHRCDVFSEHDYFLPVKIVALADEAAFDRRGIGVHLAEIGLHPNFGQVYANASTVEG